MEPADYELVEAFLDQKEKKLFYQMDPPVQKHCVNVTREILATANSPIDNGILTRAALLHDIGKLGGSFNLIDRILYVLLTRVSVRLTRRLSSAYRQGFLGSMRYAFYIHLNHEAIGAELAEKNGISKDIVYLIANHHNQLMARDSAELSALLAADELN